MIRFIAFSLMVLTGSYASAQTMTAMPLPITHPSAPESAPSFTGNGRTLLYEAPIGDYDRQLVAITYQNAGVWSSPVAIPGISMKVEQVYNGGAFITFEGNYIFFSSSRYGGIGSNDLWYLEKTGNSWTPPKNLGKPINSTFSETDPSISPDGKLLYFVRATDKKDAKGKPCGQIFVAERRGKDSYLDPKPLPAPINQACDCNPRILADNSMTFASDRPGGKGGYDQYKVEMKEDGSWGTPQPMSFINTPDDDLYISIPAGGDFVYLTAKVKASLDIVRTKIPDNLHPKQILFLTGAVVDADTKTPVTSKILLKKLKAAKQNFSGTGANASFAFLLPEKENYELTFTAKGYAFHTSYFQLDTLKKFKELRTDIPLTPLKAGKEFVVRGITIDESSKKPSSQSAGAMEQVVKMMQENPTLEIEIGSHMDKVLIDSVASAELTEMVTDTTVNVEGHQLVYKQLYHNNRTTLEATEIKGMIVSKGISATRIVAKGYGDTQPCNLPDELGVKCLNRRVTIKVLKQ